MKNKFLTIILLGIILFGAIGCSKNPENNTIDNNTSNDRRDYKKIYGTKEACLESAIGGFIAAQYNIISETNLTDIITVDMTKIEYSNVKITDNGWIYAIIKTNDENTIKNIDIYFTKNYSGYKKTIFANSYYIYVYNGHDDFDELEIDNYISICNFD